MSDRIIAEHRAIWAEWHEPSGITLARSKRDWLDLLREDPEMSDSRNWGDLAGTVAPDERQAFARWLAVEEET